MTDLSGRVALVTGSSRGIGRAVAIGLAEAGADVAVNFKDNEKAARKTLEEVNAAGRRGITVQADVSKDKDISRMIGTKERRRGPHRYPGQQRRHRPAANHGGDHGIRQGPGTGYQPQIGISCHPTHSSRHAETAPGKDYQYVLGCLASGRNCRTSLCRLQGRSIEGLTRAYAVQLVNEGITIYAVAPSQIETDMIRRLHVTKRPVSQIRLGRPEEVAGAVFFGADNTYTTGQTLFINGGRFFR